MTLPEGMSADKLRDLADWLDLYDRLGEKFVLLVGGKEFTGEAVMALRGKDVQNDIRRWADEIESPTPVSKVGVTWLVEEVPCPECGNFTVIGYLITDENGNHQHTYYVCTFWRSGVKPDLSGPLHKRCGWEGWYVPTEEDEP